MLLSFSWSKKIKFELHLLANTTFWRLVWLILKGIETVLTCFVYITWPAAITKSMLIGCRFLNNVLALHRCCEAYKLSYYILIAFSINGDSVTIMALAIGRKVKGSSSESLF